MWIVVPRHQEDKFATVLTTLYGIIWALCTFVYCTLQVHAIELLWEVAIPSIFKGQSNEIHSDERYKFFTCLWLDVPCLLCLLMFYIETTTAFDPPSYPFCGTSFAHGQAFKSLPGRPHGRSHQGYAAPAYCSFLIDFYPFGVVMWLCFATATSHHGDDVPHCSPIFFLFFFFLALSLCVDFTM